MGTMVLLAWLCRVLPLEGLPSGLQEACGILRLYNRTVHPQVRRLLLNVDLLMLFWILVRTLRFQLNTPPGLFCWWHGPFRQKKTGLLHISVGQSCLAARVGARASGGSGRVRLSARFSFPPEPPGCFPGSARASARC